MAVVLPFVATFVDKGTKKAVGSIKEVENRWDKFGSHVKAAAIPAAAVGSALVVGLKGAKQAAGDAAKAQRVLNSALKNAGYEENAKAAGEYAVELSKATGMDQNAIRAAMARLATNKTLAASTEKLGKVTMLAADMSAQGFGSIESASATLTKALNDPIKGMAALARQGIMFDKATQDAIKGAVASGDMAAAQMMILTQVSKTVGGAAVNTASSTAKMRAQYQELAVLIGQSLLPAFTLLANVLSVVIGWMTQNTGATKAIIVVIGVLVTTILALNAVMWINNTVTSINSMLHNDSAKAFYKGVVAVGRHGAAIIMDTSSTIAHSAATLKDKVAQAARTAVLLAGAAAEKVKSMNIMASVKSFALSTAATIKNTASTIANKVATLAASAAQKALSVATKLMTAAQRGLNAAMKANPIGFVIGLIMALVTALMYAWRNSETFRRIVTQAFNAVKQVATNVFNTIAAVIQPVISLLQRIIDLAKNVAGAIGDVISKIPGLKNAKKEVESAAVVPTLATGPATRAGGTITNPAPIVINVSGALDPERVARQIRDLLDAHDVRQGRLVTRAVAW